MDSSNQQPMNRQIDHLGVNKMGKNIKKSPLHQPNFGNAGRQQPQPQVYNINKNDFRDIVQQLTGSPAREPQPRPPQNHPKPPNNRLMRVRPPPLAPSRPQIHMHTHVRIPQAQPSVPPPYGNNFMRPPPPPSVPAQYDQQPSPAVLLPPTPTDVWANTPESQINAYMHYLQNSIIDPGPRQPQSHPQVPGQNLHQPQFVPNPAVQQRTAPRMNGPAPNLPSPRMNGPPPNLPSPRMNGPPGPLPSLPSPRMNGPYGPSPTLVAPPGVNGPLPALPSPRMNGPPPLLPSPTSQFLLPSPSGFLNLFSPRSPYPLLSPGYQHPPPVSPNFSFSSVGQSGILGPGPQPPPSPGYGFPLSPGFFPLSSPRWRDH